MLTSMGTVGDGKQCRQIGLNGYLIKPIRQNDLKKFLTCVLDQSTNYKDTQKKLMTRHTVAEIRRKNIKVLLVEDYVTNQKVATKQLENAGFFVTLARDGQEAVDHFSRQSFDVILMDVQMPVMDGYEATNKIRKMEGFKKKTPIIAMTAHAIKGYRECLEAGMDDFITKPLKKEILLSTVTKWLQKEIESNISKKIYIGNPLKGKNEENVKIIDVEKALKEFDNDEQFFNEVFGEFLLHVEKQLAIIKQAFDLNNYETIIKEAHSIKGGAANLVAMPLAKAASELENFGLSGNLDKGKIALDKLYYEFNLLEEFMHKLEKNLV